MTSLPTQQTWRVQAFDPFAATLKARLAVGELMAASARFTNPDDPPPIPHKEAVGLTHLLPDERADHFVVWNEQQAIGWGMLIYDLKQNTHQAHARLIVHPDYRRQHLGRAIARQLAQVARREGRNVITFGVTSRSAGGEAFARHLNAEPALPMKQSRLDTTQVSPELLREWQTRPPGDPYRLHLWTRIPDEYLQRAADLMMVMNTAPKGELDMEDWLITPEMVRSWEHMIAEADEQRFFLAVEDTRTGRLDGYTEVFWDRDRAALAHQGATAVRPEARGQKLGKWLKAAMLEHLRARCPGVRWVHTNNAHVNAAMLAINVALGFQPWATFTEWQVRLPE